MLRAYVHHGDKKKSSLLSSSFSAFCETLLLRLVSCCIWSRLVARPNFGHITWIKERKEPVQREIENSQYSSTRCLPLVYKQVLCPHAGGRSEKRPDEMPPAASGIWQENANRRGAAPVCALLGRSFNVPENWQVYKCHMKTECCFGCKFLREKEAISHFATSTLLFSKMRKFGWHCYQISSLRL